MNQLVSQAVSHHDAGGLLTVLAHVASTPSLEQASSATRTLAKKHLNKFMKLGGMAEWTVCRSFQARRWQSLRETDRCI